MCTQLCGCRPEGRDAICIFFKATLNTTGKFGTRIGKQRKASAETR